MICFVFIDEGVHAVAEMEESLVRLVESPATESEPASTSSAESVMHQSLQLRLMSCESSETSRHVEPEICGYFHAVSRTSSSFQQPQTENVDASLNDRTISESDSDNQSSVNVTHGTKSELEPGAELDNTSSISARLAAETVAEVTTELMSDAELVSEPAADSSVPLSVPGTNSLILFYSSFYSVCHKSSLSLLRSHSNKK